MIFVLNYYLILMITSGGMILLKMQCPALPGMINTFLEFSRSKVTMLLVKVKGWSVQEVNHAVCGAG